MSSVWCIFDQSGSPFVIEYAAFCDRVCSSSSLSCLQFFIGLSPRFWGLLSRYLGYVWAAEFFAVNGYPCPSLRNPSDHFLRTINKDFDQDIEQGSGAKSISASEAINILENSYKSSHICQEVADHVITICRKGGGALEKGSQASFLNQSLVLTRRSFVNMHRDKGYYWLRLAIYVIVCLAGGTIFYNIGYTYESIQARGSLLLFTSVLLTFMAIGGFPSFVEDMKVFRRERLNGHYGVTAFVIGNTLSSLPYLLLTSLFPGIIIYYLSGLQKGFEHFAYFAMLLFACTMLVESLMMIVASIVPNFLMGIIIGAGIQVIMALNGGFFRLPGDLPRVLWKYPTYYISFHKYALQGLFKNEFPGLKFPHSVAGGPPTFDGEEVLKKVWQVEMGYSKWVNLAILFGMVIIYRILFLVTIKTIEKVSPLVRALQALTPKQATQVMEKATTPI